MSTKQTTTLKVSPLCTLMALALVVTLGCFAEISAQWTTNGNDISNTNSGNVGIGTTTPGSLLEVKKSQSAATTVSVDNPFTTSGNSAYSAFVLKQNGVNRLHIASVNDNHSSITPGTAHFWNFANAPAVFATNNAERMRISATGNVGINTANPGERFVTIGNILGGNITTHTQLYSTYDSQAPVIMELGYGTATADTVPYPSLVLSKNLTGTAHLVGALAFANSNIANGSEKRLSNIATWTEGATNSGALGFGTTLTGTIAERMRISANGKVGIGTTTPTAYLHVMTPSGEFEALRLQRDGNSNGWGVAQLFTLKNSSGSLTDYAQVSGGITSNTAGAETGVLAFYVRNAGTLTERMRVTNAGSVGIGTGTPGFRLDVQGGSINSSGGLCIAGDCKTAWSQVGGTSQWATSGSTINYSAGNVGIGVASPGTKLDVNGTVNATALTVSGSPVVSSQWATSGATVNYATGNVGIATASPTEKLHVTGNIKLTGNIDVGGSINAKYQDMAEWVESSQQLSAGTVVVLDSTRNNQVVASTKSYDSRVAGVISLKPGIALGEQGEDHVLVATTGRVRVKVDASNGPIQIGDLLVTGDKTGVAMKSMPIDFAGAQIHRPGTLLGKALEPLAKGTGEILVLLSLQ